ncbi:hypothetical protein DSO57_1039005 [Entomophthora muscae]|uniref:Uncharacterized protein n=2 Tax=Entomophthora muscae TaxID=34485 RepID=A0ACC2SB97_9FUNG|nr:hypothetical protein DSO57_1039005 [Entomophthora muscae]
MLSIKSFAKSQILLGLNSLLTPGNQSRLRYRSLRIATLSRSMSSQEAKSRENEIVANLNKVSEHLKELAHTCTQEIRLVAVSKTKPNPDLEAAYSWGQRHFGENYVQELVEKSSKLPGDIKWHFIGSLQSNKCKVLAAIPNLWAVETLSSIKQADLFQEHRMKLGLSPINIFIQVNTSREENKSGISPKSSELLELSRHILEKCPSLILKGLMTIGSISNSIEASESAQNPDFTCLNECRSFLESNISELANLELSMGMSTDYSAAILAGSTNVRVGSTIFGSRV